MKKFIQIVLVLFSLSLFSCSNSSFLMTLSDSENAVIIKTSIENGVILDPDLGKTIDISMEYDETLVIPVKLEISFLDKQGLVIGEPQIIEGDALNEPLPSISLASPLEALYSVRLRVFDNDDIIIKEEIISFFYSRDNLSIRGLNPFPNVFEPGGLGLIFFDADGSDNSWVRWSLDNEIIEEGYFKEYTDGFIWNAPLVAGVYGLRMELFPVEPLYVKNGTFPFTSPIKSELEVFVTNSKEQDPSDLYPAESYSTVIHFKGLVVDLGANKNTITSIGSPVLMRQGDKLGYYLKEGSGYSINKNILPVSNNKLMPFSATFSYSLANPQLNANFLNIIGGDNTTLFSIKTDSSGVLLSELYQAGTNIRSLSEMFPEEYNEITLSIVPDQNSVVFLWYGDGILISSKIHNYRSEVPDNKYESIIGVESGFEGLLDEFGLFYLDKLGRNNIDDNIFQRRAYRKYNPEKILAAYGFDGLYFDDIDNQLLLSFGSAIIDYSSSFQFMETDLKFSNLYLDIDFEEISESTEIEISFPDLADTQNIYINLDDFIWSDDIGNYIQIELNLDNNVLSILSRGEVVAENVLEMATPALFKIVNNSKESVTKIASLLVRREEKRVVEEIIKSQETKI